MPSPTRLGTAIASLPLLGGARVGATLVVVSRNVRPTRVIGYDLDDRSIAFDTAIDAGDGAWGVAADRDRGWVYLGLLGARGRTNLYRVAVDDGEADGVAAIDAPTIWDLGVADDGTVVGVTDTRLSFAWDPASGRARALGLVGESEAVRAVTVAAGHVVVGGNRHNRAWLRAHPLSDAGDGAAAGAAAGAGGRDVLPASLADHQTVYALAARGGRVAIGTRGPGGRDPAVALVELAADGSHQPGPAGTADGEEVVDAVDVGGEFTAATVRRSGAALRLDHDGGLERLPAPVPHVENRAVSVLGGALVGVAGKGAVWSMTAGGDAVDPVHLVASGRVAGSPERVQSVAAAGDRALVGGSFGFADHDLAAGTSRWQPAPGEAKAIAFADDGDAFLALYPLGAVHRVAAGGREAQSWAQLDPEQNRPKDLAWMPEPDVIAVTTAADRRGGGALHLIGRATGDVSSHVDVLARAEHPTGLAVAGDRLLVGGSGADPTLLGWDATADREVWRTTVTGAGALVGMAVVGGRLVAVGSYGVAISVDPADGTILARRELDGGGPAVAVGGAAVVTDGDRVWRLDPEALDAELVAEGLAGDFWSGPDLAAHDGGVLVIAGRELAGLVVA